MLTFTEDERRIRSVLCELIEQIVEPPLGEQTWTLRDNQLLAYDFGLESIELVALAEQLRELLGVRVERLLRPDEDGSALFDRLSVRWVVDQALAARDDPA